MLTDARGAGLFLAVTIVAADGEHAAAADRIVNGLRDRGVLLGSTGPGRDVLKIRPPLVFSRADADRLVAALADTLAAPS